MSGPVGTATTALDRVGPQSPTTATPPRRPGSIRRTCSTDVTRGDDARGTVRIIGRARDLVTGADGQSSPAGAAALSVSLDVTQSVASIVSAPARPELEALVGRPAGPGFRSAAADALPEERRQTTLLYLLLDDLPVVTLVSGYALQHAGALGAMPRGVSAPAVDLCSGWRAGGALMTSFEANGIPSMTLGPPAPGLESPADPDGWHEVPAALAHTVRRRRRIDVTVGGVLTIDAMFRDSHHDADGVETVLHEYTLTATIDPSSLVITDVEATPRVLPYVECPSAAASAARLVGQDLDALRERVRADFVGISTCTHLTDLVRSLEDVRGMVAAFRAAGASPA